MTVAACRAFLDQTREDAELAGVLRAVTDVRELVALGRRSGYAFELEDLGPAGSMVAAEADDEPAPAAPAPAPADAETRVLHHELALDDVPALAPLLAELPRLKIRPATVDLAAFRDAFRADDLAWTSMAPSDPAFRARYDEVMRSHWDGSSGRAHERRDFHLVNLDHHIDDARYEEYFAAKVRVVRVLERVFGPEARFSGSMWYPPFAYRLWHTNETQPGWRMYLVDFDEPVADDRTFFRYMNPQSREVVTLPDRPRMLRFFRVDQRPDRLFWHCIVNAADRDRWSFGFAVPDDWMARLMPRRNRR